MSYRILLDQSSNVSFYSIPGSLEEVLIGNI